jgi:hypothetical protein
MARGAPQRCPKTGEAWFFVHGENGGERIARLYYDLAIRHFTSFAEISRMFAAVIRLHDENNDELEKEVEEIGDQAKRTAERLKNHLSVAELADVWRESRRTLERLAQLFPDRRAELEVAIAEHEATMIELLERHERKARAN